MSEKEKGYTSAAGYACYTHSEEIITMLCLTEKRNLKTKLFA